MRSGYRNITFAYEDGRCNSHDTSLRVYPLIWIHTSLFGLLWITSVNIVSEIMAFLLCFASWIQVSAMSYVWSWKAICIVVYHITEMLRSTILAGLFIHINRQTSCRVWKLYINSTDCNWTLIEDLACYSPTPTSTTLVQNNFLISGEPEAKIP